jgi:hypothetical protein
VQSRGLVSGNRGGQGGSRPLPLNLDSARRHTNRSFASRFLGNLGTMAREFFPAVGNMAGAVGSDTVMRAIRAGRGQDAGYDVQSWDALIKPVGQSLAKSATLAGSIPQTVFPGEVGSKARGVVAEEAREFWENPGFSLIEHGGNVTLAGAALTKPLGMAARSAAGATRPTRLSVAQAAGAAEGAKAARAATRGHRKQQLRDIEVGGGQGAGLARASNISGDIIGRPFTAAARGARDVSVGGRASLGEVFQQVRESGPVRLDKETGGLDYTRVEPTSPVAQSIRHSLDEGALAPVAEATRRHVGSGRRLGNRIVNDTREAKAQAAQQISAAGPEARQAALAQNILDSTKDHPAWAAVAEAAPLRARTGVVKTRLDQFTPQEASALADALGRVPDEAIPPVMRGSVLDQQRLDLWERAADLPAGTLNDRVMREIHLNQTHKGRSQIEALREADTALRERGLASKIDQELGGVSEILRPEGPPLSKMGLEQKGLDPSAVQATIERVAHHQGVGEGRVARELEMAGQGVLAEHMDPVLKRTEEGGWRAPEAGETHSPARLQPSKKDARRLEKLTQKFEGSLAAANKIEAEAAASNAAGRAGLRGVIGTEGKRLERLAREISRTSDPAALSALRAEWGAAQQALRAAAEEAGVRLPDRLTKAHKGLEDAALADAGTLQSRAGAKESGTILEIDGTAVRRGDYLDPADADMLGVRIDAEGKAVGLTGWEGAGKKPGRAVDAAVLKAERARKAWQEDAVDLRRRGSATLANVKRAAERVARVEDQLTDLRIEIGGDVSTAPAPARPTLTAYRQANQPYERLLRDHGLGDLADQLDLSGFPSTYDAMIDTGVTPGFLRILLDKDAAGATAEAFGQRGAIRPGRLDEQIRREMDRPVGDVLETSFDATLRQQQIGLVSARIANESLDYAQQNLTRKADQLAVEHLGLDADAVANIRKTEGDAALARQLHEAGMVEWRPSDPNTPIVTKAGDVSSDAMWLHRSVAEALTENLQGNIFRSIDEAIVNPMMRGWKGFVLATRPAWQVANTVSNGIMASWRGGIDPVEYMRLMAGPAQEAMRRHRLGMDPAPNIPHSVASELIQGRVSRMVDDAAGVRDPRALAGGTGTAARLGEAKTSLGRSYSNFVTRSYALNNYMDNLNRMTVMLANADGPTGVRGALDLATQALGDYSKMSRIERQYIKAVFPFWAWQRHIAKLTATSFGPSHITRTTMALHLMHLANEPDEWRELLNPYEEAMVGVGGTGDEPALGWQTRRLNPFGDAFEMVSDASGNLSPLGGMGRQAGPIPQLALERLSGVSSFTGRPFTTAVPELDRWNREKQYRPGWGRHVLDSLMPPQGRMAQDLARAAVGAPRVRYDSGEPVVWEDAGARPLWDQPAKMMGVDIVDPNLAGRREAGAKGSSRTAGRLTRYEEDLQRARGERRVPTLADLVGRLTPGR